MADFHRRAHIRRQIGGRPDDERQARCRGRLAASGQYNLTVSMSLRGIPHRTRSPGRTRRSRRCVLRHPDGTCGRELPDQRAARARRSRHRHRPRQESRGAGQHGAGAARRARSATQSSRPPTKCSAARSRDQFVVDVYQAGAGTSHNMNANEVLANRAAECSAARRASTGCVHPNDHVNMGQSTNDVFPTATRLALLLGHGALVEAARGARRVARAQGRGVRRRC